MAETITISTTIEDDTGFGAKNKCTLTVVVQTIDTDQNWLIGVSSTLSNPSGPNAAYAVSLLSTTPHLADFQSGDRLSYTNLESRKAGVQQSFTRLCKDPVSNTPAGARAKLKALGWVVS